MPIDISCRQRAYGYIQIPKHQKQPRMQPLGRLIIHFLCLPLAVCQIAYGADQSQPKPEVQLRIEEIDKERRRLVEQSSEAATFKKLLDEYKKNLGDLKLKLQKSKLLEDKERIRGVLEALLEIESEISGRNPGIVIDKLSLNPDLSDIQKNYNRKLQDKSAGYKDLILRAEELYEKLLSELLANLTRSGSLEDAEHVSNLASMSRSRILSMKEMISKRENHIALAKREMCRIVKAPTSGDHRVLFEEKMERRLEDGAEDMVVFGECVLAPVVENNGKTILSFDVPPGFKALSIVALGRFGGWRDVRISRYLIEIDVVKNGTIYTETLMYFESHAMHLPRRIELPSGSRTLRIITQQISRDANNTACWAWPRLHTGLEPDLIVKSSGWPDVIRKMNANNTLQSRKLAEFREPTMDDVRSKLDELDRIRRTFVDEYIRHLKKRSEQYLAELENLLPMLRQTGDLKSIQFIEQEKKRIDSSKSFAEMPVAEHKGIHEIQKSYSGDLAKYQDKSFTGLKDSEQTHMLALSQLIRPLIARGDVSDAAAVMRLRDESESRLAIWKTNPLNPYISLSNSQLCRIVKQAKNDIVHLVEFTPSMQRKIGIENEQKIMFNDVIYAPAFLGNKTVFEFDIPPGFNCFSFIAVGRFHTNDNKWSGLSDGKYTVDIDDQPLVMSEAVNKHVPTIVYFPLNSKKLRLTSSRSEILVEPSKDNLACIAWPRFHMDLGISDVEKSTGWPIEILDIYKKRSQTK